MLGEFAEVWERIGLNSSQRQVRRETMGIHMGNLMKDILQEEQELEKSMISSLQSNEMELTDLCGKLGLPMDNVSVFYMKVVYYSNQSQLPVKQSLYEREKDIRSRVDALNKVPRVYLVCWHYASQ